ncbi:hypothetical protein ASG85_00435 [Paenibacillus sp. Soil724D2]|nr:hypothetical protein ASG85_00435 [Paenibacillus sp. Soil724D2]
MSCADNTFFATHPSKKSLLQVHRLFTLTHRRYIIGIDEIAKIVESPEIVGIVGIVGIVENAEIVGIAAILVSFVILVLNLPSFAGLAGFVPEDLAAVVLLRTVQLQSPVNKSPEQLAAFVQQLAQLFGQLLLFAQNLVDFVAAFVVA